MADLAKAYVQIIPSAEGITESLSAALGDGAESAGKSAGATIAAGVSTAIVAGTTAIAGFAATSVQAGKEFDTAMSSVAATMGVTTDEIGELREYALQMGSSTAFSATEAAEALNYMALAGYTSEEAMAALPNVLNLAAAGDIALAAASDMVTDAQSALGLSFEETATLVDQMAMAASKSNTSVEQLGSAILTVGGTAKNLSGGTTELATALGILADNGIKGAEGGTSLRNMLISLTSPTDSAKAALDALGVSVFDDEGNMRSLDDVFGDLAASMENLTQEERMAALSEIFNSRDLKSAEALLSNVGERWDELSGYIDNAAGSAQKMAETKLDNLEGDVTMFKSALEGAQIAISDALTPSLREFVQFGTEGISEISAAFQSGGLSGAAEALGQVLSNGIARITEAMPELVAAGGQLLLALAQGILSNAGNMVSAGAQAITTLAQGLSEALPTLIPVATQAVLDIVNALIDNAPELLIAGLALLQALGQGLLDALPTILAQLPTIIGGLVEFFSSAIPQIIEVGITLFTALVSDLPAIIEAIVAVMPALIEGIVSGLLGSIADIIEAGVTLLTALVDNLPAIVEAIVDKLPEIIDGIVNGLLDGDNLGAIIQAGVDLFIALLENIPEIVETLISKLPEIVEALANGIVDLSGKMVEAGEKMIDSFLEGMEGKWDDVLKWVADMFGIELPDAVYSALDMHSPSRVFMDIGENMALGVGIGFVDTMHDVNAEMTRAVEQTTAGLAASADVSLGGGISEPEFYNVTIDASSVKEFNDIVNLSREKRRLGRMVTA